MSLESRKIISKSFILVGLCCVFFGSQTSIYLTIAGMVIAWVSCYFAFMPGLTPPAFVIELREKGQGKPRVTKKLSVQPETFTSAAGPEALIFFAVFACAAGVGFGYGLTQVTDISLKPMLGFGCFGGLVFAWFLIKESRSRILIDEFGVTSETLGSKPVVLKWGDVIGYLEKAYGGTLTYEVYSLDSSFAFGNLANQQRLVQCITTVLDSEPDESGMVYLPPIK